MANLPALDIPSRPFFSPRSLGLTRNFEGLSDIGTQKILMDIPSGLSLIVRSSLESIPWHGRVVGAREPGEAYPKALPNLSLSHSHFTAISVDGFRTAVSLIYLSRHLRKTLVSLILKSRKSREPYKLDLQNSENKILVTFNIRKLCIASELKMERKERWRILWRLYRRRYGINIILSVLL